MMPASPRRRAIADCHSSFYNKHRPHKSRQEDKSRCLLLGVPPRSTHAAGVVAAAVPQSRQPTAYSSFWSSLRACGDDPRTAGVVSDLSLEESCSASSKQRIFPADRGQQMTSHACGRASRRAPGTPTPRPWRRACQQPDEGAGAPLLEAHPPLVALLHGAARLEDRLVDAQGAADDHDEDDRVAPLLLRSLRAGEAGAHSAEPDALFLVRTCADRRAE